MVLDLRLIKIGCRETVNLFFIPPLFLHKKPPPSTPKKAPTKKFTDESFHHNDTTNLQNQTNCFGERLGAWVTLGGRHLIFND